MYKTWEQFLIEKHEVNYDFSSTQINLPDAIAKKIMDWGKTAIPDAEVHSDPDGGKGREDDIHVTVLYGIHDKEPNKVHKLLKTYKKFDIELGEVSVFSNDAFDVVKLSVKSPEIHRLNAMLNKECENSNSYPTYIPHVTVAYVKKGKGKKYAGRKQFAGTRFRAETVTFSSSAGSKTDLDLQ